MAAIKTMFDGILTIFLALVEHINRGNKMVCKIMADDVLYIFKLFISCCFPIVLLFPLLGLWWDLLCVSHVSINVIY